MRKLPVFDWAELEKEIQSLPLSSKGFPWTEEEKTVLKRVYPQHGPKAVAKVLENLSKKNSVLFHHRSIHAIRCYASMLDVKYGEAHND